MKQLFTSVRTLNRVIDPNDSVATATFLIAAMVFVILSSPSFAQTSDTVRVYANPPGSGGLTIDQVIMADTNSTGKPTDPNRVWLLQQTNTTVDTPYYYQNTIDVKGNITIIGERNPITGMPPILQPWKNINNTAPSYLVAESGDSCTITLKDLYILGQRYDSVQATKGVLQITGQDVRVVLDHCVVDNVTDYLAYFLGTATGGSIFATNCEMRNASDQFWRAGDLFWANSPAAMDSVVIQDCTFFLQGRCIYGGPVPFNYLLLNHNTLFFSSDAPLLSDHQINATITNNIFYGADGHGADSTLISKSQTNDVGQPYGIIMMDSTSKYGISEASRKVTVQNNVYFWPDTMFGFWKTLDDTASASWWYSVPPSWMNLATLQKFNDKTDWPGFTSANNDSVDPQFDPTLVTSSVDNLIKFEYQIYGATQSGSYGTTTFRWWQLWTNPSPYHYFDQVPSTWKGWASGYPVPENLKYSNTSLYNAGTDGKPLGDLNWFPELSAVNQPPNVIPSSFGLSQNYPNPFNPTTRIDYSVPRNGYMTLEVYNILGQKVATLFSGIRAAGNYTVTFNASMYASGVYFYRLRAGTMSITRKLLLMK